MSDQHTITLHDSPSGLLTLTAAARQLNVHPATLRRWADRGDIRSLVTPGGHRRFVADDVQAFVDKRRAAAVHQDLGAAWADKAIQDTRAELQTHARDTWMVRVNSDERERYRLLGQRLMGLLLRHVARDDDDVLPEAERLGQEYGTGLRNAGLSLTEAMAATMFFRDALLESTLHLPDTVRVKSEQNMRLLRRLSGFLNIVQLAIAHTYDPLYGTRPTTPRTSRARATVSATVGGRR